MIQPSLQKHVLFHHLHQVTHYILMLSACLKGQLINSNIPPVANQPRIPVKPVDQCDLAASPHDVCNTKYCQKAEDRRKHDKHRPAFCQH